MKCTKCGAALSQRDKECPDCGYSFIQKKGNTTRDGLCKNCHAPGRLVEEAINLYLCFECYQKSKCKPVEERAISRIKISRARMDLIIAQARYYLRPLFYGKNPTNEPDYKKLKEAEVNYIYELERIAHGEKVEYVDWIC